MNPPLTKSTRNGKIVTFYSYKGGTGRSMALANVAWLLASCGNRVLVIDWDLEAPGLHRYFEPFLSDKTLERSTGLIDFVLRFATAAVSGQPNSDDPEWFTPYSNLLAHAVSLQYDFQGPGTIDFVPAGRQDAAYANRVNSFNWQTFYEKLGGGVLLEVVKRDLRKLYDFILIDSRTGVSDTSGICTIQMPDELVVCFTLNRQSIYGAVGAARSSLEQRKTSDGSPTMKIWPVPMRVEPSEKDRLELAQTVARTAFSGLMHHLEPVEIDEYWSGISVGYEPYYAYEEVLAYFRDRYKQQNSVLSKMQAIAERLSDSPITFGPIDESLRNKGLAAYSTRSTWDYLDELGLLAVEYERIRKTMEAGDMRTAQMSQLVGRVQVLSGQRDSGEVAEQLFNRNTDGARLVGLALARVRPERRHINMALDGVSKRRSPFEQYHALLLLQDLMEVVDPNAVQQVREVVSGEINSSITVSDVSRWLPANQILKSAEMSTTSELWVRSNEVEPVSVGEHFVALNNCEPSMSFIRYDDPTEAHGPFVSTRGVHQLRLPPAFRVAKHLVTNGLFMEFVKSEGYQDDSLWKIPRSARLRLLTADGETMGPIEWPTANEFPDGKVDHPVSGISFCEAQAFVQWCCRTIPIESNRMWSLTPEDLWEYAARGEAGLNYPWGDAFDISKCNSAESGIRQTTQVTQFEASLSPSGCCDMAGNVWEYVLASDMEPDLCVLRGGSFKNNRSAVRRYLRLIRVPQWHRPPDFGFRLSQVEATKPGDEIS